MSCVIFGAGKIARGFVGHLLYLSNIDFTFVEKVDSLVDLINERGQYTVNILGDASKNT
ncbi:MAG: mannitol-1-phosphate 5-dehydrogenase, partial [Clostridia bacterium]|nr:mannitol-1-phosphate 5-dehydrogenase [Clostridia bacterium]